MAPAYAAGTSVPEERSRAELERALQRAGATEFAYGWGDQADEAGVVRLAVTLGFKLHGVPVRVELPMPQRESFARGPKGRPRSTIQQEKCAAQERRRRWRALLLVVKAKLEAVETGITTLEAEFMAAIVTPSGKTIGQRMLPDLRRAVESGKLPNLLGVGS